ncbi:hypothetical protein [Streptomyces purpurogeneiscleroticus]|uniref:hypothetical protein n=1 Tax=Streptomyces purpurogeneiscleroticus TaxID=68259 RepID=UPI001CBE158E|nr:hypothetical protein [Streptomyces purpurogeneiscleroticus]MBZ4020681.1 hypothetical protein [Streptomyces purpurogeneiscleroticus]
MARRHLRLTAVVAVVLLSLTGFRPHGRGSDGGDSGGGGCSASSSSGYHGSSNHYDDDDDDDYSGSGDSTYDPYAERRGKVVGCVSDDPDAAKPGAKVELVVEDPNEDVTVTVEFRGADRTTVDTARVTVNPYMDALYGYDSSEDTVVAIPMAHPARADKVTDCVLTDLR